MVVKTLTVPSADEQQKLVYNRKVRAGNSVELSTDQDFVVVLLCLAPGITEADYPVLGAAITAISGIQGVDLLVDGNHSAPADIPENTRLMLCADVQLRIDDV